MNLLITADKVRGQERPTLFKFDGRLSIVAPYQKELDDPKLVDSGRETFRPFGIGADKDHILVASNTRLGKFSKVDFSFCGLAEGAISFTNTHEIWVDQDTTYITNTANDSIGAHKSGRTRFFSFKNLEYPTPVVVPPNAYKYDTKHINSVEATDRMLYVVALNDSGNDNSAIYFITKNNWKVVAKVELGNKCHGVRRVGNTLYTLSTGTGELLEFDLEGALTAHNIVDPNKFFLRGLRYANGNLYFVASQNFGVDNPPEECWLYVMNEKTKTVTAKHSLLPILVVNDIYALEG
jgi:hypothetical protein